MSTQEEQDTPTPDTDSMLHEQAVAGLLLMQPTQLMGIMEELRVYLNDFVQRVPHALVRSATNLLQRGNPLDLASIAQEAMNQHGVSLDQCSAMSDKACVLAHAEYHLTEIGKASRRRRAIPLLQNSRAACLNQQPVDNVIASLMTDLRALYPEEAQTLKHSAARLLSHVDQKTSSYIPFYIPSVDSVIPGARRGRATIVAGFPSVGKTTLIINAMLNQAKHGLRSAFISLDPDMEEFHEALAGIMSGVDTSTIRTGRARPQDVTNFRKAITDAVSLPLHLVCRPMDTMQMLACMDALIIRHQVDLIYLDFIQDVSQPPNSRLNIREHISNVMKAFDDTCRRHRTVAGVALSQLRRAASANGQKTPTLQDLKESAVLEEKAFAALLLWEENGQTKGTLAKHKRGARDKDITIQFDKPTGRMV